MKTYKFSVTNGMLNSVDGFGSFGSKFVLCAINQAQEAYPDCIIERIEYEKIPSVIEGYSHEWIIYLKTLQEFNQM